MAPGSNWLSFSLSPMDHMMLRPSSDSQFVSYDDESVDVSSNYLMDNFYTNGWANQKPQETTTTTMASSPFFTTFIDHPQTHNTIPKLEDFFADSSSTFRYSDQSQTETQDSSLTQIYDHHNNPHQNSGYFTDQQDLKAITGFQTFSTNSSSEVDDSVSIARTQFSESIESSGNELGFHGSVTNGLSLGVNNSIVSNVGGDGNKSNQRSDDNNNKAAIVAVVENDTSKKIVDTFGQRTSIYRGVTRHRWTGRYEAHLWDNSCRREGQARKGRQVYLGGYDKEDKAARAYDLAALKYWGPAATTNFPMPTYAKEVEEMKHMTKQEFIASLRRKSSGFSRGASMYRGVTRHHQQGRWQARIGRVAGNKDLYLGTFATEEEAAEAYDIAAIKFRGLNAVTNFEMNRYDVEAIAKSALPVGGAAKRLKLSLETEQHKRIINAQLEHNSQFNTNISFAHLQPQQHFPNYPTGVPFDNSAAALYHQNLYHYLQSANMNGHNDSTTTTTMTPPSVNIMAPQQPEFFLWPNQPY